MAITLTAVGELSQANLDELVTVEGIDPTARGIAAICVRGTRRQSIEILEVALPAPGSEWITSCGQWAARR
jgi:hypothetical protein